jgi:hypothetical protein
MWTIPDLAWLVVLVALLCGYLWFESKGVNR